jgi:hypothetical protein
MSSTCSSCASRTDSSCPGCSRDGLSVVLLGVSVLSDSLPLAWRGSMNDGELVVVAATNGERVAANVVTNGEIVGSVASNAPVLIVRVDDGVGILRSLVYWSSACSSAYEVLLSIGNI